MSILKKIVAFLKKEPVSVWGTVFAAVLGVLSQAGLSAGVVSAIAAALSLLGIPVVRSKVSPK